MQVITQLATLLTPRDTGVQMLKDIEHAGRNCYASYDRVTETSYKRFVHSLIERGHDTPLEFASLTYALTTSRAVLCELTRHRLASFCVESQRYIQEAKTGDIAFIQPEWYTENDEDSIHFAASTLWKKSMLDAENAYKELISLGAKPQEAREVLPNSTACRIIVRANLREWRHIFNLRCSPAAYPQMRSLASQMLTQAQNTVPVVFDDIIHKDGENP